MTLVQVRDQAIEWIRQKDGRKEANLWVSSSDPNMRRIGKMMHVLLDIGYGPE